jgi:predicted dienelactone hydrolase
MYTMQRLLRSFVLVMTICLAACNSNAWASYDPLAVSSEEPEHRDFTVSDVQRSREIPLRLYLPHDSAAAPVVLFSHGLGGTREGSAYLGDHWALRGYVAVFLQHPGSDDSVWKGKPISERMSAMKAAASLENFELRVQDVKVVLDQLKLWNDDSGHELHGRLDLAHIGMSGHSFGAITTQYVSGQRPSIGPGFTDPRIQAAVIMSPSAPRRGDTKVAFAEVKIPWMVLTGTKDTSPISDADAASRLLVFPALPGGDKYELVLFNAEHSAFTDRALPGDSEPRNPNHHRAILALTTAFWDAYLRNDPAAKAWLNGDAVNKILEATDRWQTK